jgi:hypothetical protein
VQPDGEINGRPGWYILSAIHALDGTSLTGARERKLAAEAALAELDLAERQGKVVPLTEATSIMVACLSLVRTRNLALPYQLAAHVPHEVKQVVFDICTREVHRMLRELSETKMRGRSLAGEAQEVPHEHDRRSV